MSQFQKRSWFPLVIIVLTLCLAGFMVFALRGSFFDGPAPKIEEPAAINEEDYRTQVAVVFRTFEDQFRVAQDQSQKTQATQQALAQLLELRVPAQYKDLHLSLAIVWNQLQAALVSGVQSDVDASLEKFEGLTQDYSWLIQ